MAEQNLEAGFVRNRRFLIAASVGLACVNLLGLTFSKVNIFGNEADIHNPHWIYAIAWIVWVWAFAHYVVWYRDIRAWESCRDAIVADCWEQLGKRAALGEPPEWIKSELDRKLYDQRNEQQLYYPLTEAIEYLRRHEAARSDPFVRSQKTVNVFVTASTLLPDDRGHLVTGESRYEVPVSNDEWRRQLRRSMLTVLLTRRFTLEYFAPFAIGALPVVLWVYTWLAAHLHRA